jgi:hypothetical protein
LAPRHRVGGEDGANEAMVRRVLEYALIVHLVERLYPRRLA